MADTAIKQLELAIRRLVTNQLSMRRPPVIVREPTNAMHLGDRPRIVLLRQDRIGDVLVSIPVIRALRARFPHAVIDVVLSPNNVAAKEAIAEWVNETIVYHKTAAGLIGTIRRLRKGKYDVIVDLMDNPSATSSMLISRSGARKSLGIDKGNRGVYTHVVPLEDRTRVHIVRRIAKLVLAFDMDPTAIPLDLTYSLSDTDVQHAREQLHVDLRPILGVNITGSDATRQYPTDAFAAVIQKFMATHPSWRVALLAAPADQARQLEMANASGAEVVQTSASFHEFARVVSQCSMILSADTSIVHLASCWKIPAVILYVFNDESLMPWYPFATPNVPLYAKSAVREVSPDLVGDALDALSSFHIKPTTTQ